MSELRTASSMVDPPRSADSSHHASSGSKSRPAAVWHELVREPLLGGREVALEEPLDHRLELAQQAGVHPSAYPTYQ